jgi:hypothetical protein
MIIAQRFIAGSGGPTVAPFSPVGTAEFPTPRFSRPYGTNTENPGICFPSTEVLGYFQVRPSGQRR